MIKPGNLLIVRTDRIGDVILTLPLAGIIKKYYPECKVTFLIRQYTAPLVRNTKFIDNFIELPESSGKLKFLKTLKIIRSNYFDTVLVVYPTFFIALIMFLSSIKQRIGTGYRWYSFLFNRKVFEHRKDAKHHELEYNVRILNNLNINEEVKKSNVSFSLSIDPNSELKTEKLLLDHIQDKSLPLIIVHPGSSGSAVDLPMSKMRELVEIIQQNLKVNIVLTGNEKEIDLCSQLIVDRNIINLAGMLNLEELKAIINKSSLLIANSTGPLHIAAALGKNVIGFYPKVKTCSPERWGPYTIRSVVFQPKSECSNCTIEQCKKTDCMNSIDIDEVFIQVRKVIIGN